MAIEKMVPSKERKFNKRTIILRSNSGPWSRAKSRDDFAREERLGIFSPECYQTEPPNPKCPIKGNIIHGTNAKEYTMPSCDRYVLTVVEKYKGESWFCTETEAKKAGYIKSPNCN
jgi:hypothetical protein